jgi:hypothetical protein
MDLRSDQTEDEVYVVRCRSGRSRGRFAPTTASEASTIVHAKTGVVKSDGPVSDRRTLELGTRTCDIVNVSDNTAPNVHESNEASDSCPTHAGNR